MIQHLFWQGMNESASAEHCRLMRSPELITALGVVIGFKPVFQINYTIRMDAEWGFQSISVEGIVTGKEMNFYLEKDSQNEWWRKEQRIASLSGCLTIDLSASPFTNTLAIQRAALLPGQKAILPVAYIDVSERKIVPANQEYSRLSLSRYRFFSEPDFEAMIDVDKDGLVTDYPGLFRQRI